jgi:shikimate dehydrogenase
VLCRAADAAGCAVVDGLEVLARQGALAFVRFTGRDAPLDVMRAAARG